MKIPIILWSMGVGSATVGILIHTHSPALALGFLFMGMAAGFTVAIKEKQ